MHFLAEYGLFFAKSLTITVLISAVLIITIGGILTAILRQKKDTGQRLEVIHLNKQYSEMESALFNALLSPSELKEKRKAKKKADKAEAKTNKKMVESAAEKRIFVLDFDGDVHASEVELLRFEISAILTMARVEDEVVVRLESQGGAVHGYGLAASQLRRIRDRQIPLTVCVDKVAASGGYMMACVADKILAAPFAFIGSIGVVAQSPNLHRLLQKYDIDFDQLVAGKYKRTLTLFGKNTDKARKKMQQELNEIHDLFKDHVKTQRPMLDIESVATGEYWLGSRALELGLVDKLQTSDDYLMALHKDAQLVEVKYTDRKSFIDRLTSVVRLGWSQNNPVERMEKPLLM